MSWEFGKRWTLGNTPSEPALNEGAADILTVQVA
jgi:hypothetical protein